MTELLMYVVLRMAHVMKCEHFLCMYTAAVFLFGLGFVFFFSSYPFLLMIVTDFMERLVSEMAVIYSS